METHRGYKFDIHESQVDGVDPTSHENPCHGHIYKLDGTHLTRIPKLGGFPSLRIAHAMAKNWIECETVLREE